LLRLAESAGYDVFLIVDRAISHEQQLGGRLSIILIRSQTNQIEDLLPLVDSILRVLKGIKPGR
jgi:hypothetical protein